MVHRIVSGRYPKNFCFLFYDIRAQYFLQFYFERYEYDSSMLVFDLFKLLKILSRIHGQQSTHLYYDLEAAAEHYLFFLMICGKKNTWSF